MSIGATKSHTSAQRSGVRRRQRSDTVQDRRSTSGSAYKSSESALRTLHSSLPARAQSRQIRARQRSRARWHPGRQRRPGQRLSGLEEPQPRRALSYCRAQCGPSRAGISIDICTCINELFEAVYASVSGRANQRCLVFIRPGMVRVGTATRSCIVSTSPQTAATSWGVNAVCAARTDVRGSPGFSTLAPA